MAGTTWAFTGILGKPKIGWVKDGEGDAKAVLVLSFSTDNIDMATVERLARQAVNEYPVKLTIDVVQQDMSLHKVSRLVDGDGEVHEAHPVEA